MNREFKGVWIPADIYRDTRLTWTQKLMLVEIDSFSRNGLECFVSNEHLSEHLQVGISAIEKCLKSLVDMGLVERGRVYVGKSYRRTLRLTTGMYYGSDPEQIRGTTRNEVRHTNTLTNSDTKPRNRRQPNSIEDVQDYFVKCGRHDAEDAAKFFDYYTANGWTQGKGKAIKDWQAAARNWMRNTKQWSNERQQKGFDTSNFSPDALHGYLTGE